MATGYFPFKGSSIHEFIDNISHCKNEIPEDLDSDLVYIIKSMLSSDPLTRPSIEEILTSP